MSAAFAGSKFADQENYDWHWIDGKTKISVVNGSDSTITLATPLSAGLKLSFYDPALHAFTPLLLRKK